VAWNTFKQLTNPTVHYGLSPHSLAHKASSDSSVTYPTSRTWANTVKLNNLHPYTTYYYKIESTNSTIESFKTARLAGDHASFAAALVVDMGVFGPDGLSERNVSYTGQSITSPLKPKEQTTIQRLVKSASSYEFVLHPGDLAYADSWLKELKLGYINGTKADGPALYEGLLEQFYDQLSDVSKSKAYMVGPGNHEANCVNGGSGTDTEATLCPVGQTNFTQYINRFGPVMPTSQFLPSHNPAQQRAREEARRLSRPPFWYSFDYGMAHFLVFDTETDLGVGLVGPDEFGGGQNDADGSFGGYKDQQHDFIINDLAGVNRDDTPWVVVAGHRPWYVSSSSPCIVCQEAFEPLFLKGGVDLAMFGHVHNAEVIKPIANNVTDPAGFNNPKAPMYIVQGAAGHFEGLDSLFSPSPPYVDWANDQVYSFAKILFKDKNHLEVQIIESNTGAILHSAPLFKEH